VFDFSSLSPDLILDGIESTGVQVDSGLLALNSYENRVYQFHDDNRVKYVTKFYRPQRWSKEAILEEHEFALELAEEELPIVAPLVIDGTSLFEHKGYYTKEIILDVPEPKPLLESEYLSETPNLEASGGPQKNCVLGSRAPLGEQLDGQGPRYRWLLSCVPGGWGWGEGSPQPFPSPAQSMPRYS